MAMNFEVLAILAFVAALLTFHAFRLTGIKAPASAVMPLLLALDANGGALLESDPALNAVEHLADAAIDAGYVSGGSGWSSGYSLTGKGRRALASAPAATAPVPGFRGAALHP